MESTAPGRPHFTTIHVEQFAWTIELDTRQIHDLFSTFSDWSTTEVAEAARAVHDLGGHVTEHYLTPLIILRRTAVP
ncbi:hypothetical protein [Nocardia callitridis]|uniref:Uncharacterized protein n=1 Tax=Nocardia callitridis TaxID=648753 RepID=A0ABP9L1G3_9NOCA